MAKKTGCVFQSCSMCDFISYFNHWAISYEKIRYNSIPQFPVAATVQLLTLDYVHTAVLKQF